MKNLEIKTIETKVAKVFIYPNIFYFLLFVYLFYCCKIVRAIDKIIVIPMNYTNCFYCKP